MQNDKSRILFLYGKGEGNNVNETHFKIKEGVIKKLVKVVNIFSKDKEPDFILEKKFEKGKYSILLLSSEFDSSKNNISLLLDNTYKTDEFPVFKGENFIFNIQFQDHKELFMGYSKPPNTILLTEHEQFHYFIQFLESKNMKNDKNPVKMNFNRDVVKLFDKPFDLDFYMDVFKELFRTKYIKILLSSFKLQNIKFTEKFEFKNYSALLKLLLKKGDIISQKVEGNDKTKKNFLEQFYFIIMYIYYYFDSDSFANMIKMEKGDFEINFFDLFYNKEDAFSKKKNDECVDIMFKSVKKIEQIKCLIKKFSSFLNCINAINVNIKRIYLICKKAKNYLEIKDFPLIPEEEKISDIIEIIRKIKDFESEKKLNILNLDIDFCKVLINKISVDNNFEDIISLIETFQDEKKKKSLYLLLEKKKT